MIDDLRLKTVVFSSEKEMMQSTELCFGVSVTQSNEDHYTVRMHFDDSETRIGRTQSNIPRQAPLDVTDGEPKPEAPKKYIQ